MPHTGKPSGACQQCKQRHVKVKRILDASVFCLSSMPLLILISAMKQDLLAANVSKPNVSAPATWKDWILSCAIRTKPQRLESTGECTKTRAGSKRPRVSSGLSLLPPLPCPIPSTSRRKQTHNAFSSPHSFCMDETLQLTEDFLSFYRFCSTVCA